MVATEQLEELRIPGLDAEAEACGPVRAENLKFGPVKGFRVGFKRPFSDIGERERLVEAVEEKFEVGVGEEGWCAAAEKNGFDIERDGGGSVVRLGDEGGDESFPVRCAGGVLVESTVGADSVAEGNVDVEVAHRLPVRWRDLNHRRY